MSYGLGSSRKRPHDGGSPSRDPATAALEDRRDGLRAALAAGISPPPPISVHPDLPEPYRRWVERLDEALSGEDAAGAMETGRGMVERVVPVPREGERGLDRVRGGRAQSKTPRLG